MVNLLSIYQGKKIFITGHTGFKGTWLLVWLRLLGAEVKGYSLAPQANDLFPCVNGDLLCQSIISDIRDQERLKAEIVSFQPDFIFHLAAQPLVRLSYQMPVDTFSSNVIGTAHVLDALRYLEKPCATVLITTDKVYHNLEINYSYKEDDRLGGHDPYSASKAAAELIVSSYCKSFFSIDHYDTHHKAIAIARAGNVIGGGDWSQDRIIPDIIRALSAKNKIIIRNPYSVRPWQHVLEPLGGYLVLGAKLYQNPKAFSSAWNFGPNDEDCMTVESLVKIAINHWGDGGYQISEERSALHEARLLKLDISKASTGLAWRPKWSAETSIQHTILWYKQFLSDKESALKYTEQQINQYDLKAFV